MWQPNLHLCQLKAIALRNLTGALVLHLHDLIKLPQLEYLEVQTTPQPNSAKSFAAICHCYVDIPQAEALNFVRPFMLAMSRTEGMPDTPAKASPYAWDAMRQQHKEAAAVCLERVFGPQDRHNLVKGAARVLKYIPMREQVMDMEIVYCNAPSRKLANQLMTATADCKSENSPGWAPRKVEYKHTISMCNSCRESRRTGS